MKVKVRRLSSKDFSVTVLLENSSLIDSREQRVFFIGVNKEITESGKGLVLRVKFHWLWIDHFSLLRVLETSGRTDI